jgi:hypothetical protein
MEKMVRSVGSTKLMKFHPDPIVFVEVGRMGQTMQYLLLSPSSISDQ